MAYMLRALDTLVYTKNVRMHMVNGQGGVRKTRTFLDPLLGKALGGHFGFQGSFPPDLNRLILLLLCWGVANSCFSVGQASVCDVVPDEHTSTILHIFLGCNYYIITEAWGRYVCIISYCCANL